MTTAGEEGPVGEEREREMLGEETAFPQEDQREDCRGSPQSHGAIFWAKEAELWE